MANSFTDIQVTGSASYSFSIPYLSQDHIKVYVGGTLQTLNTHYTFTNAYTIEFTSGNVPADTAQYVRVLRSTAEPSRLVTYSNTGLDADDLNRDSDQVFYMAQEAVDTIELLEGLDVANLLDTTTESYERSDFLGSDASLTADNKAVFPPALHNGNIGSIVQVYLNGVLLKPTTTALDFSTGDYDVTAASGLSISPVPAASDEITVVKTSAIPQQTFDDIVALSDSASLVTTVAHGGKSLKESYTATAGQTVINLTNTYVQNINNVSVYVNGVRQSAYDETTTSSITLNNPLSAGDEIVVIINEYAVNQAGMDASLIEYTGTQDNVSDALDTLTSDVGTLETTVAAIPRTLIHHVDVLTTSTQSLIANNPTEITGLSVTLTPQSATSKFFLSANWNGEAGAYANHNIVFGFKRDLHPIGNPPAAGAKSVGRGIIAQGYHDLDNTSTPESWTGQYVDMPNTTDEITYKVFVTSSVSLDLHNNKTVDDLNSAIHERLTSSLIILEIA